MMSEKLTSSLKFISTPEQISRGVNARLFRAFLDCPLFSHDMVSKQLFFLANEHEEIIPLAKFCLQKQILTKPIKIVNYDFHYDDSPHDNTQESLRAGWQRYGLDIGLWTKETSFTVVPKYPSGEFTCGTEYSINDNDKIPVADLCSIELDLFNHINPNSDLWNLIITTLLKRVEESKVTMVFLTPLFCRHDHSIEIARMLFQACIKKPYNNNLLHFENVIPLNG